MCEPVYHNTLPLNGATTTECDDNIIFFTRTKLIESVNEAQREFKKSEPTKELTDKYRYQ